VLNGCHNLEFTSLEELRLDMRQQAYNPAMTYYSSNYAIITDGNVVHQGKKEVSIVSSLTQPNSAKLN
jgi:hypothetical protein